MMRKLRILIAAGLVLLLGAMLIATIYFTLFDLQWLAFLAGVLFAAVAAMASQASKAQWLIMRRTGQLQRVKDQLAQESLKLKHAAQALKRADERFQIVNDKLPVMIVFIDRDERCRYHNHAFAQWCKHGSGEIDGQPLRNVVGDETYRELKSNSADVLAGEEIHREAKLEQPGGGLATCNITLLPFPPGAGLAEGFYALIAQSAGAAEPDLNPRAELVRALQEDEFILFAQTIRSLTPTPYPQLAEVLLRLQEEELYMIPPGSFFPVAERFNLMPEIDRWVVKNLIKWIGEKQRSDPAWPMPLYCVNLAGASLHDPEFALYVRREVQSRKFPGGNLCFEIAEPDVLNQRTAVQAFMSAMRPLGCRFALDNFGSTQESFAPLEGLTLDFLKIDGAIIQNILTSRDDYARTREIVTSSRKLGLRTIAVFVESDAALEKLREIGVDYAQGFGISKPGPIA